MRETARQERSSWTLQMAMLLRDNNSTPSLWPKSHHPSLAWRFQEFGVCVWALPLAPPVTSWLKITLIHSAGAFCTSCVSSDFPILFPSLSTSSPPSRITHAILRLQTVLCYTTLHPGISLIARSQKSLLEFGFLTEHLTWAIKLCSNIRNFPKSGTFFTPFEFHMRMNHRKSHFLLTLNSELH